MKAFRLNRLLNTRSGRCLEIAVDHALPADALRTFADANPDAISLSIGQAELLQSIPGKHKPALVLRTDVTNIHGADPARPVFCRVIGNAVEQAIRFDAACAVVRLFHVSGQPALSGQRGENIQRIGAECARFALPMMIESLAWRAVESGAGFAAHCDLQSIRDVVRHAVDFGADLIRGCTAQESEKLGWIEALASQAAVGVSLAHGIIQHLNPAGLIRAAAAILHDGASALDAARFLDSAG